MTQRVLVVASLICLLPGPLLGQITEQRLVNAAQEPQNWLTYSGAYASHRYSTLDQIDQSNVKDLAGC